ncbi:MAG: type I glyceraldehyde-3-phosphate dehydrogenase [Firmicutes bacterium]|nr:type I glyceraldehyde-3-phosphate dehydrogenase [Bacillota bacterium]
MIKVAINGFGRIGRLAYRQLHGDKRFDVVAINDLTSPDMLAYLLKYDSAQKRWEGHDIKAGENSITIDGDEITIYKEADASKLPWKDLDIDVVLECTGFYTSKAKAQAHLDAGAKKVLISAPAGDDLPTVVFGVNQNILKKEDTIVSGASCTTNCLAPMTKVLHEMTTILSGMMTTVHAYTGDQMILDGPHRKGDFRRARAGALNIVPNTTGAAKAIANVIPELKGKLVGNAMRVPVPAGSITILDAVVRSKEELTVAKINDAMKAAASDSFGYTDEQIVSTDVVGSTFGSLFDASQTMVCDLGDGLYEVRITAWYDNENGYTSQLIRTFNYMCSL